MEVEKENLDFDSDSETLEAIHRILTSLNKQDEKIIQKIMEEAFSD